MRLRYNGQRGATGVALLSTDTAVTNLFGVVPGFATIVAPDFIPLVLEPNTANMEIVYLTAYTSGSRSGTIARAQEDATLHPAVAHALGVTWDHGPTINDFLAPSAASIAAASAGINSTETQVVSLVIPAGMMVAGSTYRITASGVCTSTGANVGHFRARLGTTTLTGNIAVDVSPTAAASGTAIPFLIDMLVTVRTAGATGTLIGSGSLENNGVTGVSATTPVVAQTTATVAVDTTAAKLIELTFQAAAATTTCTFHNAEIALVK